MIRKTIIVVLTLAAITSALLWLESWRCPRSWAWSTFSPEIEGSFDCLIVSPLNRINLVAGTIYFKHPKLIDRTLSPTMRRVGLAGFWWSTTVLLPRSYGVQRAELLNKQLWYLDLRVPLWAPFVLFVTCPTLVFLRGPLRRWRHRRRGQCLECGYDLRGSTERCPECGTGIVTPSRSDCEP